MSDGSTDRTSFARIGTFLDDHWPTAALCISGIGMAFLGPLTEAVVRADWQSIPALALCLIIVPLYVAGVHYSNKRSTQNGRLIDENKQLRADVVRLFEDHREVCSRHLMPLADELGFRGTDRVSLYKYETGKFVLLARRAEQPELNAAGRAIYPADQGVIGAAWTSGEGRCFVNDLPDPSDLRAYKKANQSRFNFPPNVVDGMAMRSRTIGAYVLMDHVGLSRAAIVLFESLEPARFLDEELFAAVSGPLGKRMSLLLDVMKTREPSPQTARDRGF